MFLLYEILTKIDCLPELITENYRESILNKLDEMFVGKILKNEGVCICIFDMKIIETFIIEGYYQASVDIKVVVFKPFVGEVLVGKITESTAEGITVDMVFTQAFIPAAFLNENSGFDEIEGVFVWHYEENELFYDIGENIKFKVNAFLLPEEDGQNIEILGRVNEDGLGILQWWV